MSRDKFVHELRNAEGILYGITSDIYMLPTGTEFSVSNGYWDGEIVEKEDVKYMHIIGTGRHIELKEDEDYNLVVELREND